jgi:hypothetical protein
MKKLNQIDWRMVVQLGLGVAAGIIAAIGTIAVAVTSFSLSFDAIEAVAKAAHVRGSIAWMMPVTVDGAMSVATITAVVMHRLDRSPIYPWIVVGAGVVISIACNAAHAIGEVDAFGAVILDLEPRYRMAISAIPALMLALSVHLLVTLIQAFHEMASPVHSSEPQNLTAAAPETVAVNPPAPSPATLASEVRPALPAPAGDTPSEAFTSEPVPASPVKSPVKPRPQRRPSPRKRGKKVNLASLSDVDLLQLFRDDFGVNGPASANRVRVRYGIAAAFASEAFARWGSLTSEASGEAASEVAQ